MTNSNALIAVAHYIMKPLREEFSLGKNLLQAIQLSNLLKRPDFTLTHHYKVIINLSN